MRDRDVCDWDLCSWEVMVRGIRCGPTGPRGSHAGGAQCMLVPKQCPARKAAAAPADAPIRPAGKPTGEPGRNPDVVQKYLIRRSRLNFAPKRGTQIAIDFPCILLTDRKSHLLTDRQPICPVFYCCSIHHFFLCVIHLCHRCGQAPCLACDPRFKFLSAKLRWHDTLLRQARQLCPILCHGVVVGMGTPQLHLLRTDHLGTSWHPPKNNNNNNNNNNMRHHQNAQAYSPALQAL